MNTRPEWDLVTGRGACGDTYRLRVPGGWIYRERECGGHDAVTTALAMTFVPDPVVYRTRERQP